MPTITDSRVNRSRWAMQSGMPDFVEVDVEGFAYEVLSGLIQSVKSLPLEIMPEFMESTVTCIRHIDKLGRLRFNYSIGESMVIALQEWVSSSEMLTTLEKWRFADSRQFGDIYAALR